MLSILVCHSYFLRFDQKQQAARQALSTARDLAGRVACCARRGTRCRSSTPCSPRTCRASSASSTCSARSSSLFYEDNYNFLSKMCLGTHARAALRNARGAARTRVRALIAAGSDASDAPDKYLAAGADAVLHGEGAGGADGAHRPARPRRRAAMTATRVAGLPDVSVSGPGGRHDARGAAARLPEPAQPSLPAWDLIDIEKYRARVAARARLLQPQHGRSRAAARSAATGARSRSGAISTCSVRRAKWPRRCSTCGASTAPDHIWFADDIFGFRVDWVNDFARRARRGRRWRAVHDPAARGPRERAHGRGAARRGLPRGVDRRRERQPEDPRCHEQGHACRGNRRTRAACWATQGSASASSCSSAIWAKSSSDILATRGLVDEARPDDMGVSVSYPLPGTKFYERGERSSSARRRTGRRATIST